MESPAPERSCIYIEYPKCLYNQDGLTMTVDNGEEESAAREMGWVTAEEYNTPKHDPLKVVEDKKSKHSRKSGVPEGEEGHKEPA